MANPTVPVKTYRITVTTKDAGCGLAFAKKIHTYYSYKAYQKGWAYHKKDALYFARMTFPVSTEMVGILCNTGKCLNKFKC